MSKIVHIWFILDPIFSQNLIPILIQRNFLFIENEIEVQSTREQSIKQDGTSVGHFLQPHSYHPKIQYPPTRTCRPHSMSFSYSNIPL